MITEMLINYWNYLDCIPEHTDQTESSIYVLFPINKDKEDCFTYLDISK